MNAPIVAAGLLVTALFLSPLSASAKLGLAQPTNSILTLTISRGDSPWLDMTDSYDQEQSNRYVKAVALDTATHAALPSLAAFDKPDVLMGRNTKRKEVVVNGHYFGDLRRGDATRTAMGKEHLIGEFRDRTFTRLRPRDLVLFLIQSQLIETYWHLEARVLLLKEEDRPDAYRACFWGIHTYFTNDRHDEPFAFVVRVNKKTGGMTLVGGDLLDPARFPDPVAP
jgi:hypothetical protein